MTIDEHRAALDSRRRLSPEDQAAEMAKRAAPGLLEMAGNLAGSVVAHVADGGRKASPEVQAERKALCESCPLLDLQTNRCQSYGCILMDLRRSWASSQCPLDPPRWDAV
jgi:hypothetical protein